MTLVKHVLLKAEQGNQLYDNKEEANVTYFKFWCTVLHVTMHDKSVLISSDRKVSSHEINSHEINSHPHQINSHQTNFLTQS